MASDLIPLADAMAALRAQLTEAREKAAGSQLQFDIGSIEVEFQTVVQREGTTGGKVGFMIFGMGGEANANAKLGDARTQKVKLVLTPRFDGQVLQISDTEEAGDTEAAGASGSP